MAVIRVKLTRTIEMEYSSHDYPDGLTGEQCAEVESKNFERHPKMIFAKGDTHQDFKLINQRVDANYYKEDWE